MKAVVSLLILLTGVTSAKATSIPDGAKDFLVSYCIDCHDAENREGDVDLDLENFGNNGDSPKTRSLWERALQVIDQQVMPPADAYQPSTAERESMAAFLDEQLKRHTPIGGDVPRRLARDEYETTIRELFQFPDFELPDGFPADPKCHGFRNLAAGLVSSPPLMESQVEVAIAVADEIFPPPKPEVERMAYHADAEDLVLSFSAGVVLHHAFRLASSSVDIMRSCTWPSRIEIGASGVYAVRLETSLFQTARAIPLNEAAVLEIRARRVDASERSSIGEFRKLKEVAITSKSMETLQFDVELYQGETLCFYWKNSPLQEAVYTGLHTALEPLFKRDPRFLAAWQSVLYPKGITQTRPVNVVPLRGYGGWEAIQERWRDPRLDLSQATLDSQLTKKMFSYWEAKKAYPQALHDCLCSYYHEIGPSVQIHGVTIDGPLRLIMDDTDRARAVRREKLFGKRRLGQSDAAFLRSIVARFLPLAFRRPVEESTQEEFVQIVEEYWRDAAPEVDTDLGVPETVFDAGMHLFLRSVLLSPRFLFRSLDPGELDDYDLAARLSYFLTNGPPDAKLIDLAQRNRLGEDWVLRREAGRLLPKHTTDPLIRSFMNQWLDLDSLDQIMPDSRFGFSEADKASAKKEAESLFLRIVQENLPIHEFITPSKTYVSPDFIHRVYGVTKIDGKRFSEIDEKEVGIPAWTRIDPNGRFGGLLGMSAVMTATANGVDTQPVLRGVWVLENILGQPTPEPPKDVPALTPDTASATNPRELLALHTDENSCSACHRRIDPFGFALENFDPVGKWRDVWPKTDGARINASVTLWDGTPITGPVDLKHWLARNIRPFAECLSYKLLTYATGRVPNYAERAEISKIVDAHLKSGAGFRNLLLDLIASKTFRTR